MRQRGSAASWALRRARQRDVLYHARYAAASGERWSGFIRCSQPAFAAAPNMEGLGYDDPATQSATVMFVQGFGITVKGLWFGAAKWLGVGLAGTLRQLHHLGFDRRRAVAMGRPIAG